MQRDNNMKVQFLDVLCYCFCFNFVILWCSDVFISFFATTGAEVVGSFFFRFFQDLRWFIINYGLVDSLLPHASFYLEMSGFVDRFGIKRSSQIILCCTYWVYSYQKELFWCRFSKAASLPKNRIRFRVCPYYLLRLHSSDVILWINESYFPFPRV